MRTIGTMDRRTMLQTLAAAAAAALVPGRLFGQARSAPAPRRVVVIGAGIVGSSIGWHLARRGCEVTILEARGPAAQASGHSFAWLNGGDASQPNDYHQLRALALTEHRHIGQLLDWPVRWGGSLEWTDEPAATLVEGVRRMQGRGSAVRLVRGAELADIEPGLAVSAGVSLAYAEQDGALDAAAATRVLVEGAVSAGARAIMPARVTGLEVAAGQQRVMTDNGTFEADQVVVAAGVGASAIAAMAGLSFPQRSTPGIIVTTQPMKRIVNTVLYGPDGHVHQRNDGRVVIGEKAGAPGTDAHRALLDGMPNEFPSAGLAAEHAGRVLDMATRFVPELAGARVEHVGVGWRPMPTDGLPVLGRPAAAPGLYFAVMHSGITLGPLVGRLAATEILEGGSLDLLNGFRFDRTRQG